MDAKTEFLTLKKAWIKANGEERKLIEEKTDAFFKSLSEDEKKAVRDAVSEDFSFMHKELSDIKEILSVREKLSPVLSIISVSYLAKNYFRKTPQWFYQRLNGSMVNGKSAKFTPDEMKTLNLALQEISKQISAIAV
jgi:hypothetical protein